MSGDIEKQQRDYFRSQKLKTIQEELGPNPQEEDLQNLVSRAEKKHWSKAVAETSQRELNKIRRMNPQVAEYSMQLNYLKLMHNLPWDDFTKDNFNLKKVKEVLDEDHFGLEKVKERILEHLAVLCVHQCVTVSCVFVPCCFVRVIRCALQVGMFSERAKNIEGAPVSASVQCPYRVGQRLDGRQPVLRQGVTDADFADAQEWIDRLKGIRP